MSDVVVVVHLKGVLATLTKGRLQMDSTLTRACAFLRQTLDVGEGQRRKRCITITPFSHADGLALTRAPAFVTSAAKVAFVTLGLRET